MSPLSMTTNPISLFDRGQPVRNHKHRAAAADLPHVVLDDTFGFVVERARRFVEDQDARIGHERPSNGDTLALAA